MKKSLLFTALALGIMCFTTSCGGSTSSSTSDTKDKEEKTESTDQNSDADIVSNVPGSTEESNDESNSALADWDIPGVYEFNDFSDNAFTLELLPGGKALLTNLAHKEAEADEYEPISGRWSVSDDHVELSFFEGPFISIGESESMTTGAMTKDALYSQLSEFEKGANGAFVKITKK